MAAPLEPEPGILTTYDYSQLAKVGTAIETLGRPQASEPEINRLSTLRFYIKP